MNIFGFDATLFWFILGFVFLVLEVLTPGTFLMFFGVGAWVVSALVFFLPSPPSVPVQLLAFIAVSVVSLVVFRNRLKSVFENRLPGASSLPDKVFTEQYIGKEVEVIEPVSSERNGRVELNGTLWVAATEAGPFEPGQIVKVAKVESLKLWVVAR